MMTLTCEWCGRSFEQTNTRGPIPKYCKRSHRQRAYESRQDVNNIFVYVVVVEGLTYDHGVAGVFSSEEKAQDHAYNLWYKSDGYHTLRIEELPINIPVQIPKDVLLFFTRSIDKDPFTDKPPKITYRSWEHNDGRV